MKEYKDINPLSVVNDVLIQAAEWKLAPEVVLLALKIVKQNPDIDEATAMLIARDEWDIISKGERPLSKAEQESLIKKREELKNLFPLYFAVVSKAEQVTKIVDKF